MFCEIHGLRVQPFKHELALERLNEVNRLIHTRPQEEPSLNNAPPPHARATGLVGLLSVPAVVEGFGSPNKTFDESRFSTLVD